MATEKTDFFPGMPAPAALVEYVATHVPRYRRLKLRDIRDVPPSSKVEIMANMPDFISDEYHEFRQRLFNLVLDRGAPCEVSNSQLKPAPGVLLEQTTGTSGLPGRFPKTIAERTKLAQGIWKHRRKVDPEASPQVFLPFVHLPFQQKQDQRVHDPDPAVIRQVYLEAQQRGMRWLHVQPHLVGDHIRRFNEAGYARLPGFIRVCETTGERLGEAERQTIAAYFDCKVINQFGCIETWAFGYDDLGTGDVEVLTDNVYVELLHPETQEPITRPGEVGQLALTSRHLRLLPIIRYLNGDRAEWIEAGGRVTLRLHEDRQCNMMLVNGRLVSGAALMRVWINMAFARSGYLHWELLQFVQTAEYHVTVRLGACPKGRHFFAALAEVVAEAAKPFTLTYEEVPAERVAEELKGKRYLFLSRLPPP